MNKHNNYYPMKKILSFLLLLSSVAVLNVQAQIGFKYNGHTYQNGDEFVVVLAPDAEHCNSVSFVNQGYSVLQNVTVTMTPIEMEGIDIWGLCAGAYCRQDSVSDAFNIPPSGEYTEFTMDLTIDEVPQPYSIYKMKVSNDNVACSVTIRFQAYAEGINDVASSTLTAYPNPAQGNVNISYDVNQPSTLAIYDMQGRVVRNLSVSGSGNAVVDNLPAGIYTYGIVGSGSVQKLIVK